MLIDQPPLLPASPGGLGKLLLLSGVCPECPAAVSLLGSAWFNDHCGLVFKLCGQANTGTTATNNGDIQISSEG